LGAVVPLSEDDAVATGGDVAELGVGAAPLDADVAPLAEGADAIGPVIAQPGVGAGSLSEGIDASGGDIAPLVADVETLAAGSAKAIGSGDSEAKAAAPSAMAETRRMLLVIETSHFTGGALRRGNPVA